MIAHGFFSLTASNILRISARVDPRGLGVELPVQIADADGRRARQRPAFAVRFDGLPQRCHDALLLQGDQDRDEPLAFGERAQRLADDRAKRPERLAAFIA